MKAIRVHAYGGPEQWTYEEAPAPKAESGKVLVRIHTASVNPIDFKLASGTMRQFMRSIFPGSREAIFRELSKKSGPASAA
jgi:NADPH:quinone reductase-like Zn-dependent oxidoreductase